MPLPPRSSQPLPRNVSRSQIRLIAMHGTHVYNRLGRQARARKSEHCDFGADLDYLGSDRNVFCRADGSQQDPDHIRNCVLYPAMDKAEIPRQKLKLLRFRDYYNRYGTHSALEGQTPIKALEFKRAELKRYR